MSASLSIFKIDFTGPNQHLYSNGNQQLSVTITAQKQTAAAKEVPLTPEEKKSIKVTERSENPKAPLPAGWSYDTEENEFAEGSYVRASDAPVIITVPAIAIQADTSPNAAIRYLRTTDNSSHQFMATIVIEGKTYSTNMKDFNCYISVTPSPPYRILASELTERRADAYHKDFPNKKHIDVDIYYWILPSPLKVVGQDFSEYPFYRCACGCAFYLSDRDPAVCNALIDPAFDTLDVSNFINELSGKIPLENDGAYIRGACSSTDGYSYSTLVNKPIKTKVTDTYGCVYNYRCYSENDHRILKLGDG
jgi:hypothetical protein